MRGDLDPGSRIPSYDVDSRESCAQASCNGNISTSGYSTMKTGVLTGHCPVKTGVLTGHSFVKTVAQTECLGLGG